MPQWLYQLTLLADEAKPKADATEGYPLQQMVVMMVAVGVFYYFLILRPQRREQTKRQDKLNAIKKNDRVVTIGGIIGTITNLSEDGREVTLRIDDNSKIKMLRSSVQGPYQPEADQQQDN